MSPVQHGVGDPDTPCERNNPLEGCPPLTSVKAMRLRESWRTRRGESRMPGWSNWVATTDA